MGASAHRNIELVTTALAEGGADPDRIARMRVLPDAVTTAAAAAAALGVEVGQIANSLIFDADGEPLLVLTSGSHRVDTEGRGAPRSRAGAPGVAGVRPRGDRPGDRRSRARRAPRADPHTRRSGFGAVRRGVGRWGRSASCLPKHVRRAGGGHRRRAGKRGVGNAPLIDSTTPKVTKGDPMSWPHTGRQMLCGPRGLGSRFFNCGSQYAGVTGAISSL